MLAAAVTAAVLGAGVLNLAGIRPGPDSSVDVPGPAEAEVRAGESDEPSRPDGTGRRGGGLSSVELQDGRTVTLHPRDGLPLEAHRDPLIGRARAPEPLPGPLWSTVLAGRPARPVTAGSAVIVRTTAEVALLGPDDGAVRWRRPVSGSLAARDVPLVLEDVVVLGVPGGVLALEVATGRTVWQASFGPLDADGLPVPVAASDGTVAVVVPGGGLAGIDAADGTVGWRTGPRAGLRDVPAADDARVYVLSGGALVATEIATGATAWRLEGTAAGGFTRVVAAGSQVVAVAGEHVLRIEPATGDVRWSQPGVPPAHGRPAVAEPVAVLAQSTGADATLVAYRLHDGGPRRWLSLPTPTRVEPWGQRLLVTSEQHAVRVLDPASWSVVATLEVDDPVIAGLGHGDRLVLVAVDGQTTRVRAFGPVP